MTLACPTLTHNSTLVPEPYSDAHRQFITDNSINHFQIGIEPNKDPFVTIPQCSMAAALGVVLNPANHPLLIHCNKGKVCFCLVESSSPAYSCEASHRLCGWLSAQDHRVGACPYLYGISSLCGSEGQGLGRTFHRALR